ncbi:MAG: TonB-dependent receptor [Asticcacaulis sp.]|uniref:TonB-dependent receptor n=1 Tax=Asticcacaulis sp. TaxID=1872648 RepID=UPI0039E275EB
MKFSSHKAMLLATVMTAGFGLCVPVWAQDAVQTTGSQEQDKSTTVVVVGKRADASRLQMKSDNVVSVMSSDDLEHTAVHNVAEALALLPGVTVTNTGNSFFGGIDGASRGEGMFVGVRGMNTEFTLALINGSNVAQGMPYSRQVQLSLLPPSGLKTIVVNKNSTAEMDGDAIGGTVDFRTPTAFNFKDNYASVTVSGRLESRARDYGDDGLGGGLSAEFARKFGQNKQFGLYVSAFYDKRNFTNSEAAGVMAAQNDGGWGYLHTSDSAGENPANGDAEANLVQTGINLGVSEGSTKRYGGNFSLDWRVDDDTSLYLRGSYARADTEQNSTLDQFVNSQSRVYNSSTGLYDLSLTSSSVRVWYETNPEKADLSTLTFGGVKKAGAWTFSPSLFYSQGNNDRPNHIEASERNNQSDNYNSGTTTPYSGLFITYDSDGYAIPLLTAAQSDLVNNSSTALIARRAGQLTRSFSGQEKTGFKFDAQYDFTSGSLQYIKSGVKFVSSRRLVESHDWTNDHIGNLLGEAGVTWADLGITDGYYNSVYPGLYDNIRVPKVNQQALLDLFYKYFDAASASTDLCYLNCNTLKGTENVSAAYVTGKYVFGNLDVIPGLRYEHTDIHNTYWDNDAEAFASNETQYNEWLPSLFLNYRPQGNAVYRASVTRAYMRPALVQLGNGVSTSGEGGDSLTVTQGNPDLKTLKSWNYDASAEWSNSQGGYAMLGLYYKKLSDYMYDNGSTQVNSGGDTVAGATYNGVTYESVTYVHPTNGGDGHVAGIEAQLYQKFTLLPGWLSGFGAGLNLTKQWSQVDIGGGERHRVQNSPDFMANLKLNYVYERLSVDLNYNYVGETVLSYNTVAGLDIWTRPTRRTDLHAGYDVGHGVTLDLSVSNLFKDYGYWSHVGKNSLAISDVVNSGSTTLLSVKYSY